MAYISKNEKYLFNEGKFYNAYLKMGAHLVGEHIHFAVYAPCAKKVYVVGDFNDWQQEDALKADPSGIWTGIVKSAKLGSTYKYLIQTQNDEFIYKSDPFAFYSQLRPDNASIVYDIDGFQWKDGRYKQKNTFENPVNIYEAHLGSWRTNEDGSFYTYRQFADEIVPYLKEMAFTHIELMPLNEHPFDGSWGYQTSGYYSITSRYGTPHDFMYLVNKLHQNGIGIILDWAAGHFCPDSFSLANFDGSMVYESEKHLQWGTYKFNFQRNEVISFLISNAMFLIDKFHIDGIRVDGVSSMLYLDFDKDHPVYNEFGGRTNLHAIKFLQTLNREILTRYPNFMMIAEESTDFPLVTKPDFDGGLGFTYKWNMGFMNDSLKYAETWYEDRRHNHNLITFSSMYNFSENFILAFSHDEVVHGKKSMADKMPGDLWQKFAALRTFYTYQMTFPGKKLNFMGSEFAPFIEWRYYEQLEWFMLNYENHSKHKHFVSAVNNLYKKNKEFWQNDLDPGTFAWVEADNNEQAVFIYERFDLKGHKILTVLNMRPQAYESYRIGSTFKGTYTEILNSDLEEFAGSGYFKNEGEIQTENIPMHGKDFSFNVKLPPLSAVCFKFKKSRKSI